MYDYTKILLSKLCSIISQSLCYGLECMRIDVASFEVALVCLSFTSFELLMSSKIKHLVNSGLWSVIIIWREFLFETNSSISTNTRNFYTLYKWNGTNALFSVHQDESEKQNDTHMHQLLCSKCQNIIVCVHVIYLSSSGKILVFCNLELPYGHSIRGYTELSGWT